MFSTFLTNKMSLASCYSREMAISLSYSPLVINAHAIFGISLSIICSLPTDTCSYIHAPCVCTYVCTICTETKRFLFAQNNDQSTFNQRQWEEGRVWLKYTYVCGLRSHQKRFQRSINFKNFPGGAPPDPPLFVQLLLYYTISFPTNLV